MDSRFAARGPVIQPHPPADPFLQFQQNLVGLAEPEVVEPADDITPQFGDDRLHAVAATARGDLPHPLLEPRLRLGRPHRPAARPDLETQKGTLFERRATTLGLVDLQLQFAFYESDHSRHHAPGFAAGPGSAGHVSTFNKGIFSLLIVETCPY